MNNSLKTIKLIGLFALLVFLFQTCKDDDGCKPKSKCEDFPEHSGGGIIGPIVQKPNQKKAPCFNPNNSNEFVYIKIENNVQSLVKSNLITGEEIILLENTNIIGQPDWGTNNKIVFTEGYQIITVDMSSILKREQLTQSNYHLYPKWLNDSIIYGEFTFNLGRPYFLIELNANTKIFDTTRNRTFTLGAINELNDLVYLEYRDDPNLSLARSGAIDKLTSFDFSGDNRIEGICWKDQFNIIFDTYRSGIFSLKVDDKSVSCIKNSCDTRSYRYLSVSSDGSRLLAERVDATDYNNEDGGWKEQSKIVIMNIDGSDEKVLFE